jgi:predicted ribosome quality control (RQC) complex YloA/Tae2 family protein
LFFIKKIWQYTKQEIIFEVNATERQDKKKKVYLILRLNEKNPIGFVEKKTSSVSLPTVCIEIFKKYLLNSKLVQILSTDKASSYKLCFSKAGEDLCLYLHKKSMHWDFDFVINNALNILRYQNKHFYTKKKTFLCDGKEQWQKESILDLLFQEFERVPTASNTEKDSSSTCVGSSEFQKEAIKRLKRRQKTILKSYSKFDVSRTTAGKILYQQSLCDYLKSISGVSLQKGKTITIPKGVLSSCDAAVVGLEEEESFFDLIDRQFLILKKMKKSLEHDEKMSLAYQATINSIKEDIDKLLASSLDVEAVESLLKKNALTSKKQQPSKAGKKVKLPYKVFIAYDGSYVFVGKSSVENDVMTKAAKGNDFWLHVTNTSGVHIVIPREHMKDKRALDKKLKTQAAILAVHYSQSKLDMQAEVCIAYRRDLTKPKGSVPGLWRVRKSDVFFVKYSQEQLQEILGGLKK